MVSSFLKKWGKKIVLSANLLLVFVVSNAYADTEIPFVKTMESLQAAISGPFLKAASIIMVVVTCLMLAFGEWGDGFKKIINIVLWLSIAGVAVTFVPSFFNMPTK